ncbi:DNA-directed DNA polymerase [Powellomyces hirtus]|uniref:DNA-directed DNA polymerase n=1 Tax=Powellomyces hirtus TaxID=109895 RepID=A0A507DTH4_9FUNG|nr:DNA-directed DNA polymerase [Powellomyces hirtus]
MSQHDKASALKGGKRHIISKKLYEVKEILNSCDGPEGTKFLCKWKGFKDCDNTWEIIKNVNHLMIFANYINKPMMIAWTEAIHAKLKSRYNNETWEVINPNTLPHNQRPICTKWVFEIKQDLHGISQQYEFRLPLKGFKQRYGINYNKTYTPVAKIATQRVLLALAASLCLKCHQMDVVTAFLNGIVTETILIYAPEGSGILPGTILQLRNCLKQAPCEWYSLLHKELTSLGFERLANDNAIYIRTLPERESLQYISVYVDDLLIFAKTESEISSIKASLHNEFNMTDLGEVNHYLRMRVRRDYTRRVIYLDQESYVNDILKRFDNQSCISQAMNPVHHARTKHIDIRHHFIRIQVDKEIHLEYLPTAGMVADSLTKPLPAPAFKYHCDNMCIKHYNNIVTPMTQVPMTELLNE